jgi:hypothetical protein
MFWPFFSLANVLATLSKIWANFPQSPGRPDGDTCFHYNLYALYNSTIIIILTKAKYKQKPCQ